MCSNVSASISPAAYRWRNISNAEGYACGPPVKLVNIGLKDGMIHLNNVHTSPINKATRNKIPKIVKSIPGHQKNPPPGAGPYIHG
jgi:hypothetical protein